MRRSLEWMINSPSPVMSAVRRLKHMTSLPHEKAEMIRRFARNYRDADISYDRGDIEWLGEFVDSLRDKATDLENERRIFALGCFFGVCLEETVGGAWNLVEDNWKFVSGNSCGIDPFECVRSQLRTKRPVSVLAAFDAFEKGTSMSDEPRNAPEPGEAVLSSRDSNGPAR